MGNKLYLHVKSGKAYEVLSVNGRLEASWQPAVIYRRYGPGCEEAPWVARGYDEFFDGRFRPMGEANPEVFDPVADVQEFHEKYLLDYSGPVRALPKDIQDFRIKFKEEEMGEYALHQKLAYDETTRPPSDRDHANYTYHLSQALDGLVDLVYVVLGTAHLHGFNFKEAWRRVHRANMSKVRAELDTDSKRGSTLDVVKPAGWEPPDHYDLVEVNDLDEPHWGRS